MSFRKYIYETPSYKSNLFFLSVKTINPVDGVSTLQRPAKLRAKKAGI